MNLFAGFPDGALAATPIPHLFFAELLPQIDSLAELKLTLHVFWRTAPGPRSAAWVAVDQLKRDPTLLDALAQEPGGAEAAVDNAIARAVGRGTLVRATIQYEDLARDVVAPNTARGRRGLATLRDRALTQPAPAIVVVPDGRPAAGRPDIFALYEQNVGLVQPLIADELRAAAELYPPAWIEDAFRQAVAYNRRNWRYVKRILERWATEGRDRDAAARSSAGPGPGAKAKREWTSFSWRSGVSDV